MYNYRQCQERKTYSKIQNKGTKKGKIGAPIESFSKVAPRNAARCSILADVLRLQALEALDWHVPAPPHIFALIGSLFPLFGTLILHFLRNFCILKGPDASRLLPPESSPAPRVSRHLQGALGRSEFFPRFFKVLRFYFLI